jgi:hypothetical protein
MKIKFIIDQLSDKLSQLDLIIPEYCSRNNLRSAGLSCMVAIPEVCASLGLFVSVVPSLYCGSCKENSLFSEDLLQIYDILAAPQNCCGVSSSDNVYRFTVASGYGEDASVKLHEEHKKFLSHCGARDIETLETDVLAKWSRDYNDLRRLVRGISAARKTQPSKLTHVEMSVVFEASLALPPQMIIPLLKNLLGFLQQGDAKAENSISAMIYGSRDMDWSVVDEIESYGFIVEEDDACKGRRNFDLSVNPDSEYLYYELLDAASYRPYCPSVRGIEERYELLYKMLGNHGIKTVIFSHQLCSCRSSHIESLRIKLMRNGIDPLVYDGSVGNLIEYVKGSQRVIADELREG